MTDPRIKAAARAVAEYVYERNGSPLKWDDMGDNRQEVARCYARVALAAADAAAWRPIADCETMRPVLVLQGRRQLVAQKIMDAELSDVPV